MILMPWKKDVPVESYVFMDSTPCVSCVHECVCRYKSDMLSLRNGVCELMRCTNYEKFRPFVTCDEYVERERKNEGG